MSDHRQGDITKLGIPFKSVLSPPQQWDAVSTTVDYVRWGDRRYLMVSPDGGTRHMLGTPIEQLRSQFGGDSGEVADPWGHRKRVHLDSGQPDGRDVWIQVTHQFRRSR